MKNKNRFSKFAAFALVIVVSLSSFTSVFCGMGQETWVTEWSDQGKSLAEIQAEGRRIWNEQHGISSTPVTQPQTTTSTKKSAPTLSHDFNTITDEARLNFVKFTSDGKDNSCYLNIKDTSSDNMISGKELNATATGKEDGIINFVSENGNVTYSYTFSNWTSEEEEQIDLTATFVKQEESKYPDTYTLSFNQANTITNNVIFKIQTGISSNTVYIYKGNNGTYKEISKEETDGNGYLTVTTDSLTEYTISLTDIGAEIEAEQAQLEAEKKAEEEKKIEAEKVTVSSEVVKEVHNTISDNVAKTEVKNENRNMKKILSLMIAVAVTGIFTFFVLIPNYRKRKNK